MDRLAEPSNPLLLGGPEESSTPLLMGIATGEVKHPIINGQASGIKQPFTNGQAGTREYLHLMELLHTREYSTDGIHLAD